MSKLIRKRAPATCHRLQTTDEDLRAIDHDDLTYMLFLLHLIRAFEVEVLALKDEDLIHGPVHASIGQEAVAAAVSVALRKTDMVASTHRAHGHFLSKAFVYYAPNGYSPLRDPITPELQRAVDRTLAEIMGLEDGWCGGRGGSMHLYDATSGNLGSNAIVGGGIPIATGAAWAQRLQDRDTVVVSYFGDGAINQGCFHEVANMAALWRAPVLYLVENNLYAVGTYVAVRDAVDNMRREPFPFLIEAKTYRYYHHGGGLPGSAFGYRDKGEEARWQKKDPCTTFPQRLIDQGIISQENNERLQALADEMVQHAASAYTARQDGQRAIPAGLWPPAGSAREDIRCEDDVFDGVTFVEQEDFTEFKTMTYVQAIAGATLRNMEKDDRVIVFGEEVANLRGGAYAATRGIKEVFPERLINTPISETGFVGMAGGLASVGLKPVAEVMFPDFAMMASDQLFNQIGKLRHMYGGQVCFPVVVRTRVAIGFGYGGQHSMDPSALFALFSGWRIVAPSNAFDYIGLFNTAMRFNDPVLVVEHGKLYGREFQVPAETMDYYVPYGKAKVVRPGTDVTVLTYLTGVHKSLQAADELAAEGISAEVIDLRTLDYTGMDYSTIGQSVQKTGSVLIVEQGPRSLTLGSRISDEIQERFFDYLDCPTAKVSALDVPPPVSKKLEETVLPSLAQIVEQMARSGRHMA
jgi:2-oxoisovalerate dehydrogenase E1 component